eukprot:TRINITY_DN4881_c0_g1_i2.p1 TRINITY_DN4881_c0_g1~~TRINITY_DN4881_c0_g1_i2.p1  ORF type:complete len:479 (-),score=174.35 TRINITY_DN4881_c0_g1_i2:80-1516(-)
MSSVGEPTFTDYPAFGQDLQGAAALSSLLADIVLHEDVGASDNYIQHGANTWAHEAGHGIDTQLALQLGCYGPNGFDFFCAFYVGNSRYVKVVNPKVVKKADCAAKLPAGAKIGRYEHYFLEVDSHAAHRSPNYILEEWNQYILGSSVSRQMIDTKTNNSLNLHPLTNSFQGPSEWAIFYSGCLAAFLADEPAYLELENVKEFAKFQIERSFELYHDTRRFLADFPGVGNTQYAALVNDADGDAVRSALKTLYGDAWYNGVVLNDGTAPVPATTTTAAGATPQPTIDANPDANRGNLAVLSWRELGLGEQGTVGPDGGGFGTVPVAPQPTLKPIGWPAESCFAAVVKFDKVPVTSGTCKTPTGAQLSMGQIVQQQHAARIWDKECGWGWLAKVVAAGDVEGYVRLDTLVMLDGSIEEIQSCTSPYFGQVAYEAPVTTTTLTTTAVSTTTTANDETAGASTLLHSALLLTLLLLFSVVF